ncbi:Olfactory receptor 7A10 [Myotis brandtii]|uniref:Olfactory receptor 7A10 n=1 Tax=Myotis brandtii TaxID=109478 RepID=S7MUT8_MYOBR|nr:Olfactory receptor 7A10 [Myotis brandtii]
MDLEIPHFFCELNQMIKFACSDTILTNMAMYFFSSPAWWWSFCWDPLLISKSVSCTHGMSSAQGKYNAFSPCVSHLSVVSLFYGMILGVYLSSAATHNAHSSATAWVMYSLVTPMLSPFIYSLRNKDIKQAPKTFFVKETTNRPVVLRLKMCP